MKFKKEIFVKIAAVMLVSILFVAFIPSNILSVSAMDDHENTVIETSVETDTSVEETEGEWVTETFDAFGNEVEYNEIGTIQQIEIETESGMEILSVTPEDGPDDELTIANGVYSIENVGNEGCFMNIQINSTNPGYYVQQYNHGDNNPVDTFNRSCLFKITRIPNTNRYVIRLMLNNCLSFQFSGNDVITRKISPVDSGVGAVHTWYINVESSGRVIIQSFDGNVLAANDTLASGSAGAPASHLKKSTLAASGDQARWILHRYTGAAQGGVITSASPSTTNGMKIGEPTVFTLKTWSTEPHVNTPYMMIHPDTPNMASATWDSTNMQLTVIPYRAGDIKIRSCIRYNGNTTNFRLFYRDCKSVPNLENLIKFIKNEATGKYMDIEGPSRADGAIIQQWQFNDKQQSKWTFIGAEGGYFYIQSKYSNLYVGVDSTDTSVVKQYATQSNYTLWKFVETSSGNYKLMCKAIESSGKVLAVPSATSGNGANLTMTVYTDDYVYTDEWFFHEYIAFENFKMDVDDSRTAEIEEFGGHTAQPTSYTYAVLSGTNVVSVNNSTGVITALNTGEAYVSAIDSADNFYVFKITVCEGIINLRLFASKVGGTGHAWIQITNKTKSTIQVGACDLSSGDNITLGKYSTSAFGSSSNSSSDTYSGLWYNNERQAYATYAAYVYTSVSVETDLSESELQELNEYISETYYIYDLLTSHCGHFAKKAWNIASEYDIPLIEYPVPIWLHDYIVDNFSDYESNVALTTPSFYGYYNGTDFVSFVGG